MNSSFPLLSSLYLSFRVLKKPRPEAVPAAAGLNAFLLAIECLQTGE